MWIVRHNSRAARDEDPAWPIPPVLRALVPEKPRSDLGGRFSRLPDIRRYASRPRWQPGAALGLRPLPLPLPRSPSAGRWREHRPVPGAALRMGRRTARVG